MARAQTQTAGADGKFTGVINNEALQRHVRDIEGLLDERKEVNDRIKESYQRAKDAGFQTPILREIIRERKLEADVRADRYALLEAYRRALGMLADTPLGEAAMQQAAKNGDAGEHRMAMPRPFAEQPVHPPKRGRGRPRKDPNVAFAAAQKHLGTTPN
jgi:uncharacterized protein (UPF0335 family)